jgi:hypothetical protein
MTETALEKQKKHHTNGFSLCLDPLNLLATRQPIEDKSGESTIRFLRFKSGAMVLSCQDSSEHGIEN